VNARTRRCVVSPEWVEKAGDLHDANNPHNRQLFDQAKAWAESWAGEGAVFGSRLDLDEKGGAVVDLMISPVRDSRGKPVISTQKALTELKGIAGERNEYAALQTSWANWCQQHLDRDIVRGTRKEITAREHMSPETYGAVMDKARESLSEPPERLRDYLLLKGEISRHKAMGRDYTPPEGDMRVSRLPLEPQRDAWPYIEAIRAGAERVMAAASRFGLRFDDSTDDHYKQGKDSFPSLSDRMHLSAVVAHCAAFCARIEAVVKNRFNTKGREISPADCWPQGAAQEVIRHERNLGLRELDISPTPERETTSI